MANQITYSPLIIDTAGNAAITHAGTQYLYIQQIVWQAPTTAGHSLVLTINGVAVARVAPANGQDVYVTKQPIGRVESIAPTTIQSGKVEIWLD